MLQGRSTSRADRRLGSMTQVGFTECHSQTFLSSPPIPRILLSPPQVDSQCVFHESILLPPSTQSVRLPIAQTRRQTLHAWTDRGNRISSALMLLMPQIWCPSSLAII